MAKRVYYIPVDYKEKQENVSWRKLIHEIEIAFPEKGFLQLIQFQKKDLKSVQSLEELKRKNPTVFYYGKNLCGIVGNIRNNGYLSALQIESESEWNDTENRIKLWWQDDRKCAKIGSLSCGILREYEYEEFLKDFQNDFEIEQLVLIKREERTADTTQSWNKKFPIYGIPVYRCEGIKATDRWDSCIKQLLKLGFFPYLEHEAYQKIVLEFWKWMKTKEKSINVI